MAVAAQIAGQRCDEHACGQRRQRLMPQLTGVLEAHDGAQFIANLGVPAVWQWRMGDVLVDPGQQLPATRTCGILKGALVRVAVAQGGARSSSARWHRRKTHAFGECAAAAPEHWRGNRQACLNT